MMRWHPDELAVISATNISQANANQGYRPEDIPSGWAAVIRRLIKGQDFDQQDHPCAYQDYRLGFDLDAGQTVPKSSEQSLVTNQEHNSRLNQDGYPGDGDHQIGVAFFPSFLGFVVMRSTSTEISKKLESL
jgi:hypothetical protein